MRALPLASAVQSPPPSPCAGKTHDKTATGLTYIPAPKLKLPGHEESYNPPKEYLPTEVRTWERAGGQQGAPGGRKRGRSCAEPAVGRAPRGGCNGGASQRTRRGTITHTPPLHLLVLHPPQEEKNGQQLLDDEDQPQFVPTAYDCLRRVRGGGGHETALDGWMDGSKGEGACKLLGHASRMGPTPAATLHVFDLLPNPAGHCSPRSPPTPASSRSALSAAWTSTSAHAHVGSGSSSRVGGRAGRAGRGGGGGGGGSWCQRCLHLQHLATSNTDASHDAASAKVAAAVEVLRTVCLVAPACCAPLHAA